MEYVINTSDRSPINWNATGADRVIQNFLNIISTFRHEVSYDRSIGFDRAILHGPADIVSVRATAEIVNLAAVYEPRITVKNVKVVYDEQGDIDFEMVS